uniref:Uncharacterized protein n=1 Tax=Timema monikensis TaxID=170555 RepID=A0A7R9E6M9_9NEOP|nr:unnamed protein product [Timema monikensis]
MVLPVVVRSNSTTYIRDRVSRIHALAQEVLRCLQKTEEIFFGDVYEPPGLKKRLRALRGDCQKSISS